MRATLGRITVAVALCLGAAGCGDDSPIPKPYTGSSKSATPSPTGAPTLPAAAKGTTEAGKIAAVRHYLNVLSYASRLRRHRRIEYLVATGLHFVRWCIECAIRTIYSSRWKDMQG